MALLRLLAAPIRRVVNFPLVQFAVVIAVILWLQAADTGTAFGEIFSALDLLVDSTVSLCARIFQVKSFTKSWLTTGFMIAYVYITGLLIVLLLKAVTRAVVEAVARRNMFGLTNVIARQRGIAAYRAWLPLERIRPPDIPQAKWEERFAWPVDDRPPYPPLKHRVLRAALTYLVMGLGIAGLLQAFTPFPVLTWLRKLASMLLGSG
jgi:hypothetical protein